VDAFEAHDGARGDACLVAARLVAPRLDHTSRRPRLLPELRRGDIVIMDKLSSHLLDFFSPTEGRNYPAAAGYDAT